MMMMLKARMRLSIIRVIVSLFLVLSSHPCACVLHGDTFHASFESDCLETFKGEGLPYKQLSGQFYECGQPPGRCICQNHTAYCNVTSPALPVLHDDIYVLDLCNDYFQYDWFIDINLTPQFFGHMNNVTELHIISVYISREAFGQLANLTKVIISCIPNKDLEFTWRSLLSIPNLRSFVSRCMWIPPSLNPGVQSRLQSFSVYKCVTSLFSFDLAAFAPMKELKRISIMCRFEDVKATVLLPTLEELFLDVNSLKSLPQTCDMQNKTFFPSLKRISLADNSVSLLGESGSAICLSQLTELILDRNYVTSFPQTCDQQNRSLFPSLKRISLVSNQLGQIGGSGSSTCLPQVTEIDVSHNRIFSIQKGVFDAESCPKLETINVASDCLVKLMNTYPLETTDFVFANPSIRSLNMTHNCWAFGDSTSVAPNTFKNSSLTHLVLDGNDFSHVSSDRFFELFGSLSNLVHLSLSNCGIKSLSAETFNPFVHLQYLDLSHNELTILPSNTLAPSNALAILYLHANYISVVPEELLSSDQRRRLKKFTLYLNPLVCSCDNNWLKRWLRSDPDLFDYPSQSYSCIDKPRKDVANDGIPDQACILGKEASVAIIITSTLLIAALTGFSLLFRYRWHFRLLFYYALSGKKDNRARRRNYVYDVFVSYDQKDFPWVRQHLMQELEERQGQRLCIHQRDFIPGHYIVTNIVQAVEHSEKVLMVFSRNFVLSQWCQFEVDYCLSHVIENRDGLLIVCLDDVTSDETLLTGAMKAALSTMTYIKWVDHPDAIHVFWERIRLSLGIRPRGEEGRRRQLEALDPDGRVRIEMQVMDF